MPNPLLRDESARRSVVQGELPNYGAEISGLPDGPISCGSVFCSCRLSFAGAGALDLRWPRSSADEELGFVSSHLLHAVKPSHQLPVLPTSSPLPVLHVTRAVLVKIERKPLDSGVDPR